MDQRFDRGSREPGFGGGPFCLRARQNHTSHDNPHRDAHPETANLRTARGPCRLGARLEVASEPRPVPHSKSCRVNRRVRPPLRWWGSRGRPGIGPARGGSVDVGVGLRQALQAVPRLSGLAQLWSIVPPDGFWFVGGAVRDFLCDGHAGRVNDVDLLCEVPVVRVFDAFASSRLER